MLFLIGVRKSDLIFEMRWLCVMPRYRWHNAVASIRSPPRCKGQALRVRVLRSLDNVLAPPPTFLHKITHRFCVRGNFLGAIEKDYSDVITYDMKKLFSLYNS